MANYDVIIVGAGPVGMTAALDLAQRGVRVAIIEKLDISKPADARCNSISSRTMEMFRSLGFSEEVRASGLPDEHPTDVTYATSFLDKPFARIRLPSRAERYGQNGRSAPGFPDSHWLTPEPVVRLSQMYLEPVLQRKVQACEYIKSFWACEATQVIDNGDSVTVHAQFDANEPLHLNAAYVIGTDGASSIVRKSLGFQFEGDADLGRTRSTLIRTTELRDKINFRPPWMAWTLSQEGTGTVIAIDGNELWLVHCALPHRAKDFSDLDLDLGIRRVLGVGPDFTYEIVHQKDWTARRLVSNKFRKGRVFIAGDAAHVWIPAAGYGMNAGIADVTNLTWMLAGVINGWADQSLLDAHELERHPITEQVSRFAMAKALEHVEMARGREIPRVLVSKSPIGWLLRKLLGRRLNAMNIPQFACEGLNFGYYYDHSPVIHYDDEQPPSYDMGTATPSSVPGCRAPHFWLPDGSSLYDQMGKDFALLTFSDDSCSSLMNEALHRNIPITHIAAPRPALACYKHNCYVVRPDRHIAWRGNTLPENPGTLLDMLVGASNASIPS